MATWKDELSDDDAPVDNWATLEAQRDMCKREVRALVATEQRMRSADNLLPPRLTEPQLQTIWELERLRGNLRWLEVLCARRYLEDDEPAPSRDVIDMMLLQPRRIIIAK